MYKVLWSVFASVKNEKEAQVMLENILTDTEITMLAKRIAIGLMIKKGYSYKQIDQTLKVSPPTITKIKEWVRYKGNAMEQILTKIARSRKGERLLQALSQGVVEILSTLRPGSNWKKLRQQKMLADKDQLTKKETIDKL